MSLPAVGTLSYNGITFDGLTKSKVVGKPIRDEAGRTVIATEFTITVDGFIQSASGTGTTMTSYIQALTAPGADFTYKDKGFFDFQVNVAGQPQKDVAWGPWPTLIEYHTLGDKNACMFTWEVVVTIPTCSNATFAQQIMECSYEQDVEIDGDGYTSLTTSGHLVIPMTRATPTSRTLPDHVDRYRERIYVDVPLYFKREVQTFKFSKDKRRLDFSFKDTEVPDPYPDNVTRITAKQRVESEGPSMTQFVVGISATITVSRNRRGGFALGAFQTIVRSRMRLYQDNQARGGEGKGSVAMLIRAEWEDDIFGREHSFNFQWMVFQSSLKVILDETSMWQKIGGTDAGTWKASVKSAAWGPRGTSGISFQPSQDAIVDLCIATPPALPAVGGNTIREPGTVKGFSGGTRQFTPERSWAAYRNELRYIEDETVVRHKPLIAEATVAALQAGLVGTGAAAGSIPLAAVGGTAAAYAATTPDILQQIGGPTCRIVMVGGAVRIGYEIPVPTLVSVNGIPAKLVGKDVREYTSSLTGIPMYTKTWRLIFELTAAPVGTLPHLANPMEGVEGGTATTTNKPPSA